MLRSWSDSNWIRPHPAPTPGRPNLLRRASLCLPRHIPTPSQPRPSKPLADMYEPSHVAVFRTGRPGDPYHYEPAYSHALAVPPVGRFLHSAIASASTEDDAPFGPPFPDPAIMNHKIQGRPAEWAKMSTYQKKVTDLAIAEQRAQLKVAQKAEAERAKKAAALKKIRDKEKAKSEKLAQREAEKKWKAARKAEEKGKAWLVKPRQTQQAPPPPAFWQPGPGDSAYRRPMKSGDGWPLMSRTMTQAIHDFDYEDRLIRTANGQIVGFF